MSLLFLILSSAIMLTGLAGVFLPVLPGVPLVFAGAFIYAWSTSFEVITVGNIVLFAVLTAIASAVDYVGGLITAKKYGASKYGLIGGILGGILGLIALGIPGLIIGQLAGVILGEMYFGKQMKESFTSGFAMFVGYILGSTVKVFFAGLIVIIFYIKILGAL
ncbi:MAG: DUF456 domain-containing protein [Clostridia bacterium]|nr:DUF456 domain-containing protein [Clostridia bacterium]